MRRSSLARLAWRGSSFEIRIRELAHAQNRSWPSRQVLLKYDRWLIDIICNAGLLVCRPLLKIFLTGGNFSARFKIIYRVIIKKTLGRGDRFRSVPIHGQLLQESLVKRLRKDTCTIFKFEGDLFLCSCHCIVLGCDSQELKTSWKTSLKISRKISWKVVIFGPCESGLESQY